MSLLEGIRKENHIVFSLVLSIFFIQCCALVRAPSADKAVCDKTKLFSFCLDFHQMYKLFLLIYSRQSQGQDLRKVIQSKKEIPLMMWPLQSPTLGSLAVFPAERPPLHLQQLHIKLLHGDPALVLLISHESKVSFHRR